MLYLAEVKNQTKGFMGGYKTELKLLASQTPEQTWNTIGGEEVINTDSIAEQTGKGTLFIVNLDNNKQLQSSPELAGSRIVNYLRHFSRTLEKSKSQELEIEEWKTSLKIQGEAIAKRQGELDRQEQLIREQQAELERLEEERNKLAGAWEQLREEQNRLNQNVSSQGEIKAKLQDILATQQSENGLSSDKFQQNCQQSLDVVQTQQQKLDEYWQELESNKNLLQQKQAELDSQKQDLERRYQQLQTNRANLEQLKIDFQTQQNLLSVKEKFSEKIKSYLNGIEMIYQEISYINDDDKKNIDTNALENMPLGDLEEIVNNLQQETSKVVDFVNMQEEELTLQKEEVKSIEEKLRSATEVDKLSLEGELADAKEAMKLLNETLVGQRRNLKKQQTILNQHINILSRRKGILDVEFSEAINLTPLITEAESQKESLIEERDKINGEVNNLRQQIEHNNQQIESQEQEYQQQEQQWQTDSENWQLFRAYVKEVETKIELLEGALFPLQEQLNQIRDHLNSIAGFSEPINKFMMDVQGLLES